MYDDLLKRLTADGRTEFTVTEIRAEMDKMYDEEIDRMYQDWLKHEEAEAQEREQWRTDEITIDRIERSQHEAAQPTSWAQATEGLDDISERECRQEMELEP